MGLIMEILIGIGIFLLFIWLIVWRFRVAIQEEKYVSSILTERSPDNPWVWPKSDK